MAQENFQEPVTDIVLKPVKTISKKVIENGSMSSVGV